MSPKNDANDRDRPDPRAVKARSDLLAQLKSIPVLGDKVKFAVETWGSDKRRWPHKAIAIIGSSHSIPQSQDLPSESVMSGDDLATMQNLSGYTEKVEFAQSVWGMDRTQWPIDTRKILEAG